MDTSYAEAIQVASRLQSVKYLNIANVTVLAYDYLITLESEVKHIWKSDWGIGKVLFLLARYPTFVAVCFIITNATIPGESLESCRRFLMATTWLAVFGIAMAEAILILRTYAVWNCNKKLLVILVSLYICLAIPGFIILNVYLKSMQFEPPPFPNVVGCDQYTVSHVLFISYIVIIFFETVILTLTLYQFVNKFRHSNTALLSTLYRDGVLYFIYIFAVSAANVVILLAGPSQFNLNRCQAVMHSTLSTRIMLHLREAASRSDGVKSSPDAMSTLRIASMHVTAPGDEPSDEIKEWENEAGITHKP